MEAIDKEYFGDEDGEGGDMAAGSPGDSASLALLTRQAEQRISRRIETALTPGQLSIDQWRVLHVLSDGAGHAMSGIAAVLMVPGPTLTKIVDRLVDAALVYRLVDDGDRRRVLAFLSDRGRELHQRLVPGVTRIEQEILDELGAGGSQFVALLHQVVAGEGDAVTPARRSRWRPGP